MGVLDSRHEPLLSDSEIMYISVAIDSDIHKETVWVQKNLRESGLTEHLARISKDRAGD